MYVETNKIIRSRDVVFDEDNTSVGLGLEMSPSGSGKTPSLVNESSKPTTSNDSEDGDLKKEEIVDGEDEGASLGPSPTLTPSNDEASRSTQEP